MYSRVILYTFYFYISTLSILVGQKIPVQFPPQTQAQTVHRPIATHAKRPATDNIEAPEGPGGEDEGEGEGDNPFWKSIRDEV